MVVVVSAVLVVSAVVVVVSDVVVAVGNGGGGSSLLFVCLCIVMTNCLFDICFFLSWKEIVTLMIIVFRFADSLVSVTFVR